MEKRSKQKKTAGNGVSTKVTGKVELAPSRSSWFARDWLWGLILILAVILIYQPLWHAGYIWDDDELVTANPCIIGPFGLKEIWTTKAANFFPLALTTFWVEHAMWGLAPLPYHLVNVFMHGACAVLLWRVLRSLQVPGAWLGAALWALHPVQVESVAWVSELKNTQSGLFFLLSILFFVRWLRTGDPNGKTGGGWNYALTLLFAALAMASKSSTAILPVILCLCAWWVEGRWHWRNLARVVPVFLLSIASSVLSMWAQRQVLASVADPQWVRSWPECLATAGDAVWFYLGKLVWPYPLITIYPRWQVDADDWISYLPLLAVMTVLFVLWFKRKSWTRPWFFIFAYFLAALLPALGLVDNFIFRYSLVFDHFQYLASMGPLALAGAGVARFSDFVTPGKPWLQSTLGAGVLLILGILSWRQAWIYESQEALWTDCLAKNPNAWVAHSNLGAVLLQEQRVDEAMIHCQKAVEINPYHAQAHYGLGNILLQKGQVDGAIDQYQIAVKINPNYAEAYNNLGGALLQRKRVDEAMAEFQLALKINPKFTESHYGLGNILLQKGQVDGAIDQYQIVLEINPNFDPVHDSLGNALLEKGRVDEAIFQYQKALESNPNDAEAHSNFGIALFRKGRADEAIAQFQKALEINPNFAESHNNLGWVLLQKGQLGEAIAHFHEALRLNPNYPNAQQNLAKAQAMARHASGSK